MNRKKLMKSKRKAVTVPIVLAIVILFTAGLGLLALGLDSRMFAARNSQSIIARCAADSGLTKAIYEMNEKLKIKPWDDSILPQATNEVLPSSNATFSYMVTEQSYGVYSVDSVGKTSKAEKKVSCMLQLASPFDSALFVKDDLTLKGGTQVTGYNSQDSEDSDQDVKIGTNSIADDSIDLGSGVFVDGEVLIGVGGDVDTVIKDQGATTGERYAVTSAAVFPEVIIPDLSYDGVISTHGSTETLYPSDSGEYDSIELKKGVYPSKLIITGGEVVLHVTGDISLGNECEIVITPGSSLVVYLDGNLFSSNTAGINNMNDPTNFRLYGTGEDQIIDLKAKSDFYGAIYAPEADVTLYAAGDIYGSFIGSNIEQKSSGNFYYDEALATTNLNDVASYFVAKYWSEQ